MSTATNAGLPMATQVVAEGGGTSGASGASAATTGIGGRPTKDSVEFLDLSRYFESSGDHFYLGER